ncbi:hypothetical protein L596_028112 [Steinernema carpocapsae]|uniref:Uncharacterized protein n=1 Tax=Steinernema carpocapsae TaxID=34508 RepID=A0A4U5LXH1_STECR|nr:hypothetical protein L596_028112 [Steinernema carpocapsae]
MFSFSARNRLYQVDIYPEPSHSGRQLECKARVPDTVNVKNLIGNAMDTNSIFPTHFQTWSFVNHFLSTETSENAVLCVDPRTSHSSIICIINFAHST